MAFTYYDDLRDEVSRIRRLLLDTVEEGALLSDAAIANMTTLYGTDEGTAKLALMLMNEYAGEPTQATVDGVGVVTWGDRFKAWQAVIADVRAFGVTPRVPDPATTGAVRRYRVVDTTDPYRRGA